MSSNTRAKVTRAAMIALMIAYALFCAVLILLTSAGDYEGMIGERVDGEVLTLCTIPASMDDTSDMAIPLLFLIAVLFVPGVIRFIRHRRIGPSLVLALGLLIFWVYSFFVRKALFC